MIAQRHGARRGPPFLLFPEINTFAHPYPAAGSTLAAQLRVRSIFWTKEFRRRLRPLFNTQLARASSCTSYVHTDPNTESRFRNLFMFLFLSSCFSKSLKSSIFIWSLHIYLNLSNKFINNLFINNVRSLQFIYVGIYRIRLFSCYTYIENSFEWNLYTQHRGLGWWTLKRKSKMMTVVIALKN